MRQLLKKYQPLSPLAVTTAVASVTLLTSALPSLASPPPTDWSIRSTGLDSEGACFRRARRALNREGLSGVRTSGDSGFRGETASTRAYILCRENGAQAYMFCAGDRANRICDNLARYMKD